MKLWLLRPYGDVVNDNSNDNPWYPWYDKAFGFVVCAETEDEARRIADSNAGDENADIDFSRGSDWRKERHPWLNAQVTACVELIPDGNAELILRDFRST